MSNVVLVEGQVSTRRGLSADIPSLLYPARLNNSREGSSNLPLDNAIVTMEFNRFQRHRRPLSRAESPPPNPATSLRCAHSRGPDDTPGRLDRPLLPQARLESSPPWPEGPTP